MILTCLPMGRARIKRSVSTWTRDLTADRGGGFKDRERASCSLLAVGESLSSTFWVTGAVTTTASLGRRSSMDSMPGKQWLNILERSSSSPSLLCELTAKTGSIHFVCRLSFISLGTVSSRCWT